MIKVTGESTKQNKERTKHDNKLQFLLCFACFYADSVTSTILMETNYTCLENMN